MTDKLYTVAGTAEYNGETKVRFANDLVSRIKILVKAGCTNINLLELPRPMSKLEALEFLASLGTFNSADEVYAITHKIHEKKKLAKKETKNKVISLDEIRNRPIKTEMDESITV